MRKKIALVNCCCDETPPTCPFELTYFDDFTSLDPDWIFEGTDFSIVDEQFQADSTQSDQLCAIRCNQCDDAVTKITIEVDVFLQDAGEEAGPTVIDDDARRVLFVAYADGDVRLDWAAATTGKIAGGFIEGDRLKLEITRKSTAVHTFDAAGYVEGAKKAELLNQYGDFGLHQVLHGVCGVGDADP
jgi:hypothetical protein